MDWRASIAIVAGLGNVGATIPYIAATARGSILPSPLAWAGGALTSSIVFAAQMTSEPSWSAVLPGTAIVYCTVIVAITLRRSRPSWTRLDTSCALLGVAAIVGWQVTGVAEVALALSIAADLILFTPMLIKTARHPASEIPGPFLMKTCCAVLAALSVRHLDGTSVSWPLYLATINGAIGLLALSPRRHQPAAVAVIPEQG